MTRTEHLLTILTEECAEVAQRASKALRFSLTEVQPGQPSDNGERMAREMADLIGVWDMLAAEHGLPTAGGLAGGTAADTKRKKVEQFLNFSAQCGTVQAGDRS